MAAQTEPYITPAEYLAAERCAETKSEYHDGQIVAMAGASREHNGQIVAMAGASRKHNLIVGDVNALLIARLRGRGCETYTSDMRVRIPTPNIYTYPDIVVVCGEPQFEDGTADTLLNPMLIIEVLSPSTERYDQGQVFAHYRTLPSLREYLLVAQDEYRIDYYRRETADGNWFIGEAQGTAATLALAVGGGCTLALADIYDRVRLGE